MILTGHSLGGSQAQLVAAYLVHEQVVDSSSISVYTFGSPRFSDLKFAIQFDKVSLIKILEWKNQHFRSVHFLIAEWKLCTFVEGLWVFTHKSEFDYCCRNTGVHPCSWVSFAPPIPLKFTKLCKHYGQMQHNINCCMGRKWMGKWQLFV